MATETTEVISREAPEIEALKLALMQSGMDLAKQPVTLPQQQVAGLSDLQQSAMDFAGQGIGSYMPYMQSAENLYKQSIGQFDPSTYSNFYNPYQQDVIDQQYQDIQRLGDQQQRALAQSAIGAGAFGGGRQAIGSAEIGRNILEEQARTGANLRKAGFDTAMDRAMNMYGNRMGRLSGAASGIASLGANLPSLRQQDIGFLSDIGGMQQQQQQRELDQGYTNRLSQMYEPYQRLGFLSDIFTGAPSSSMQITSGTSPGGKF